MSPKPGKFVLDEGRLYEALLRQAKAVLTWSWDDVDTEPARDLEQLQEAIDNIEDAQRLKRLQGSLERAECICAPGITKCPKHGTQPAERDKCPKCGSVLGYCPIGKYCTRDDCDYVM